MPSGISLEYQWVVLARAGGFDLSLLHDFSTPLQWYCLRASDVIAIAYGGNTDFSTGPRPSRLLSGRAPPHRHLQSGCRWLKDGPPGTKTLAALGS